MMERYWAALVLVLVALGAGAEEGADTLELARFEFEAGSAQLVAQPDDDTWAVIARSLALFGDRRDVAIELDVSDNLLAGTLAAQRRRAILEFARKHDPRAAGASLALRFGSAQGDDVAVLRLSSEVSQNSFCPWRIQTQLDGWAHSLTMRAGIERRFPSSDDLKVRFVANEDVPHSKLLFECADQAVVGAGELSASGPDCFAFLVSSDKPIDRVTVPQIRSALLDLGKGSGAALLPTELSGTAICEVQLVPQ